MNYLSNAAAARHANIENAQVPAPNQTLIGTPAFANLGVTMKLTDEPTRANANTNPNANANNGPLNHLSTYPNLRSEGDIHNKIVVHYRTV
jgi:hypothetical protein